MHCYVLLREDQNRRVSTPSAQDQCKPQGGRGGQAALRLCPSIKKAVAFSYTTLTRAANCPLFNTSLSAINTLVFLFSVWGARALRRAGGGATYRGIKNAPP